MLTSKGWRIWLSPVNLVSRLFRLCNTIMFGMGPTDDPSDGISLDELVSDVNALGIRNSTADEK